MDERDFWLLLACLTGLTAITALHSKMIGMIAGHQADLRSDVNWLKDNTVAHETEARP